MDRVQLVLVGLPILLFCSDVVNLFAPLPPAADHQSRPPPDAFQPGDPSAADYSAQAEPQVDGPGSGTSVELKFCASCSYRGTAMTMKRMLETSFPGIHVALENYPPPFPKRALSKAVPLLQVGAMATLMAGDQIFPRFGMVPPPWYYSLRANRFGTMASIWLFGNFAQSFLQSSGAFEVYCNGQLVFSKLSEQRFPSELELHDLIGNRVPDSQEFIGDRIPDSQELIGNLIPDSQELIDNSIPDSQELIGNLIPDSQELIDNSIPDSQVGGNLENDLVLDDDNDDDAMRD